MQPAEMRSTTDIEKYVQTRLSLYRDGGETGKPKKPSSYSSTDLDRIGDVVLKKAEGM